ncbi:vitelline membrane protein 15a-1-like [Anopheles cruzii]|uniref:vitelline membrane protein 15a-1-like n=1 Tax=Anopheles cruzii TaxID=68878 RepID=UPI0022EC6CD5|nr:vitelline membrane protein 15a-1-like [Anopheles cruzii]
MNGFFAITLLAVVGVAIAAPYGGHHGHVVPGPAVEYSFKAVAPAPKCTHNLLVGCNPHHAPVPCKGVEHGYGHHAPAPAYHAPAPAYHAPAAHHGGEYRAKKHHGKKHHGKKHFKSADNVGASADSEMMFDA